MARVQYALARGPRRAKLTVTCFIVTLWYQRPASSRKRLPLVKSAAVTTLRRQDACTSAARPGLCLVPDRKRRPPAVSGLRARIARQQLELPRLRAACAKRRGVRRLPCRSAALRRYLRRIPLRLSGGRTDPCS